MSDVPLTGALPVYKTKLEMRKSYSRSQIRRSLQKQIEANGGIFIGINLKKHKFSFLDKKGNKFTEAIEYE